MQEYIVSKLSGRTKLHDEQTPDEQEIEFLCSTDQVLYFLEYEISAYSKYMSSALAEMGVIDNIILENLR
jgi:hypothetical protein